MNIYAIRAIYKFEMARTWRTLLQSIGSPVLSTSMDLRHHSGESPFMSLHTTSDASCPKK